MLARYPKLDNVLIRHPAPTACPGLLPRLFIQENSSSDHDSDNWTPRSCDSAPVVLGQSRIFFRDQEQKPDDKFPLQWTASCGQDVGMNSVTPEVDFKRISQCVHLLHQSGYYYEGLSWHQASLKLRKCPVGTFLVRDSENANYLFTLSVQTKKGPTSIRIAYKCGQFRLDCEETLVARMPTFENVTDLIEYYVKASKEFVPQKGVSCCWLDLAGECSAPVELYHPLYKEVNSLKHLCRLTVVRSLKAQSRNVPLEWTLEKCHSLCLPTALKEYIKEYPHCH